MPGPGGPLAPDGEQLVQLGPGLLGDRVVGGVAQQQVAELEPLVAGEAGRGRAEQLPAHQGLEPGRDLGPDRRRRQRLHGALVEHLPGHGGPFQHRPLGPLQPVQPGGEQRLDAGRDAEVVQAGGDPAAVPAAQPALLDQGGQQLLQEQGVALGRPGDRAGGRLGQGYRAGQGGQQLGRLGVAERLQQQGGGVQLAPGPAGPVLQELGPGHGHQQDGGAAAVVGHVLDQVEQARLGPVEVVEHHHQRPPGGQQLQQPPERPGRLLGRGRGGVQPDQLGDPGGDPLAVPLGSGLGSSSRRSLAVASAGGSVSAMPAAWRTISATGQ